MSVYVFGVFCEKGMVLHYERIPAHFSCDKMLKPEQIKGPIPPSRDIYARAIDIAWPSALESVLVGLISSIDTIMVGTLGPAAIAAVGITTQPRFIFLAIIFSLNAGVTTVVARRRG